MTDVLRWVLLGSMAVRGMMAQVGGMGGTTPTPGTGTQSVQANPRGTTSPRPVYLSGKVVAEDGAPVTQNISIERVCGGISKTSGWPTG